MLAFPNRKTIALFVYLVVEGDRPHSRNKLVGLLWPGLPEAGARNNLRVTLSRLRRALQNMGANPDVIVSGRTEVQFRPDHSLKIDINRFRQLAQSSEIQHLKQAADLYAGPLLQGFFLDDCQEFEEWLFVQRERFHLQGMALLTRLTGELVPKGDLADAETYTRKQLSLDPLCDETNQNLIHLLVKQQKVSAAVQHYQHYRRLLEDELGIEPSVELMHFMAQIQQPQRQDVTLPKPTTPFVGRQPEINQLVSMLADPSKRLITILGPGGMGKSRVQLATGSILLEQKRTLFPDGIFLVPLVSLNNAGQIFSAVESALGVQLVESTFAALGDYLRGKRLLFLFDNFEHLLDGAVIVTQLLEVAPGSKALISSRQRLSQPGETLFHLGGMDFPRCNEQNDQNVSTFSSVELFCQSAQQIVPNFKLEEHVAQEVSQICRLVEGMPLGILLAASWMDTLSLTEIVAELEQGIGILTAEEDSSLPSRMRSIQAVMDHAWQMMTPGEQSLFMKLVLFVGGFDRAAADEAFGANLNQLKSLVKKSLLNRNPENGRYTIHELLRQFGSDKLVASGEADAAREAHAHYFGSLFATMHDGIYSPHPLKVLEQFEAEYDNGLLAWHWAVDHLDEAVIIDLMLPMTTLCMSWFGRIGIIEVYQAAYPQLKGKLSPKAWIIFLCMSKAVKFYYTSLDDEEETELIQSIPILKELEQDGYILWVWNWLAHTLLFASYTQGVAREILSTVLDYPVTQHTVGLELTVLMNIGVLEGYRENYKDGYTYLKKAYDLAKSDNILLTMAQSSRELADVCLHDEKYDLACVYYKAALPIADEIKLYGEVSLGMVEWARAEFYLGHFDHALKRCHEAVEYARKINTTALIFSAIHNKIEHYLWMGKYEEGLAYYDSIVSQNNQESLFLLDPKYTTLGLKGALLSGLGYIDEAKPILLEMLKGIRTNDVISGSWPQRLEKVDMLYYGLANVWLNEGQPADALQVLSSIAHQEYGKNLLKTICVQELLGKLEAILKQDFNDIWERGSQQSIEHVHNLISTAGNYESHRDHIG
ncbi:MAG: BTAD domain-containing putative transcriptional regulator [Chloroflexota bacterium]